MTDITGMELLKALELIEAETEIIEDTITFLRGKIKHAEERGIDTAILKRRLEDREQKLQLFADKLTELICTHTEQ